MREALDLRQRLRGIPIRDIQDVEAMATLHDEATRSLVVAQEIADAFMGVVRSTAINRDLRSRLGMLAVEVDRVVLNDANAFSALKTQSHIDLTDKSRKDRPRRPFHWPLEFPEVFLGQSKGFTAIVGNPPWASYSGRQAAPISAEDSKLYTRCFALFGGWKALHSLFIERALDLTSPDGSLGLLLPAQVVDLGGYGPVRLALRDLTNVAEPLPYFGEDAFGGVVQPTCAVIAHRRNAVAPDGEEDRKRPFVLAEKMGSKTAAPTNEEVRHPQTSTGTGTTSGPSSILSRLESFPSAPPKAFADPGIHTGNCSKKIIVADCDGICEPVREGKNIFPYRVTPATKLVRLDYEPYDGEYFTVRDLVHYTSFPILLRQTAPRPICAPHQEPTYFRNSVLACRGLKGIPNEAVVAWLNSTAVGFFHMKKIREANQKAFPQVKVKHLRALPIPVWTDRMFTQFEKLTHDAIDDPVAINKMDTLISDAYGLSQKEHELMAEELHRMNG